MFREDELHCIMINQKQQIYSFSCYGKAHIEQCFLQRMCVRVCVDFDHLSVALCDR